MGAQKFMKLRHETELFTIDNTIEIWQSEELSNLGAKSRQENLHRVPVT